jgi:hypothetical protein
MTDLIKRLEEAEEGSRELDCDLAEMLGEVPVDAFRMHGTMTGRYGTGPYSAWTAPDYTTSLDAALALAERKVGNYEALRVLARTSVGMALDGDDSRLRDLPRLLCIAILKATDTGEA